MGIVKVLESGRSGRLVGVLPIVNPVEVDRSPGNGDCSFTAAVEAPGTIDHWADPHGLRGRHLF